MRTEDDLRAALSALEREAPDPAAVLARLPSVRRQHTLRRRTLLSAAVATVAAVPLGVRMVLDRNQPPAAPAVPSHPWLLSFTVELADYQVASMARTEHRQELLLQGPPQGLAGRTPMVVVHDAGNIDVSEARSGEPVMVHGRPGFFVSEPLHGLPSGELFKGVFWEYSPDAWAIAGEIASNSKEGSLHLARAVRFGQVAPVRVPFRLGRALTGLRPAAAGWSAAVFGDLAERTSQVSLVSAAPDGPGLYLQAAPAAQLSESFRALNLAFGEPAVATGWSFPAVLVNYGSFGLTIHSPADDAAGLPTDELLSIARSITPTADYRNLDAWSDAITAIPLQ